MFYNFGGGGDGGGLVEVVKKVGDGSNRSIGGKN